MDICDTAEPVRQKRKIYPLGYTSDKAIYDWLGHEIEKAREEIELLNTWIAKCEEMREELKAKHKKKN